MNRIFPEGKPGRVLGFGAHPDDLEVGAGGLLARLASDGAEVTMAIVSVPNRREERLAEAANGAAVSCHRSQLARLDAESGRDLARAMGRISGFSYAEVFEVLRVRI